MRRSEWEDRCKRHREHRLSKGVCPYCLRDRLSHLSASSSATNTTRASSTATSSPYSSASAHSSAPGRDVAADADFHAASSSSFVNVAFSQPLMPTTAAALNAAGPADVTEAKGKEERKKGRQEEVMKEKEKKKGRQEDVMKEKEKKKGRQEEVMKEKEKNSGKKKKKIGRFLSKLVGTGQAEKRRHAADGGELFHSKTMKEKTSSKWVLF